MGLTAFIKMTLDTHRNCKFEQIILDASTFCFVNECSFEKTLGNFSMNWAEDIYAFNMIWATIISAFYSDGGLESHYHFYYKLGDSAAILIDDIIGFKPKDDAFTYKGEE